MKFKKMKINITNMLLAFILLVGILTLLTSFAEISPLTILSSSQLQFAIASAIYTDPRAIYLASLGINTSFFVNPITWLYRGLVWGIWDKDLISLANLVQFLANMGAI